MKGADLAGLPAEEDIRRAVKAIEKGGVVAVPTETYYGLAADPENEAALHRLFELKQRPQQKPILVLISRIEQLNRYVASIPQLYNDLINCYWPGPLTLVFPAKPAVSPLLTGGTGTIGVRLTPHPLARRLIDLLGRPITATSANISRHEPARTAGQVKLFFQNRLDYVVDGGPADEGPGSTVVNIVGEKLCLERPGRVHLPGVPVCPAGR